MRQYYRFKAEHPGCLLLFRMGDFYELFDDDAVAAHRALGITLTERTKGVPMAGVPFHAVESYLRRLIDQGFRVAVCEQVQDPREAKGVVERAVTRVLTPGTLVDEALLDDSATNLAAALVPSDEGVALAMSELSTGAFTLRLLRHEEAIGELIRRAPREVLISDALSDTERSQWRAHAMGCNASLAERPGWQFQDGEAAEILRRHYGVAKLEGFGLPERGALTTAAGALLAFLLESHGRRESEGSVADGTATSAIRGAAASGAAEAFARRSAMAKPLSHLRPPRLEQADDTLHVDPTTLRSLEIERTSRRGSDEGSLLSTLERPRTAMGRRRLREALTFPLARRDAIEARLRQVAALVDDATLRGAMRASLEPIQDVARIASRAALGRATPRDVSALGQSAVGCEQVAHLAGEHSAFATLASALEADLAVLATLGEEIRRSCVEAPPAHLREGGLFRNGIDAALDEARVLQRDADSWLADFQRRMIDSSGIASLKVGFNRVFGYYMEITHAHRDRVPADFIRIQTLTGRERYSTPELREFQGKVESAERRALDREQALFADLCARIAAAGEAILRVSEAIASIDLVSAFAETAATRRWCRPELVVAPCLHIVGGRHPVVERALESKFVPNDCSLGSGDQPARLALITGPNMAGKSTFIRQNAIIALLAHAGSFVPAERAEIGLVDRILTRIGSADELHAGQSTFMVEMVETALILHHATERSLVILDEIGRGTSTLDGLSLAWAIAETLEARRCRTLFATHYHELTQIADRSDRVVNLHVRVREWNDQIVFLHRIEPGRSDRSYGIHVARIAGLPTETISRAKAILEGLSVQHAAPELSADAPSGPSSTATGATTTATPRGARRQPGLFDEAPPHPALRDLREIDLDQLTPLAAFDALRRLKSLLGE
ncbi:MAG: DNA mismatch repair protein MutS [Phycisphaeraceae bacterium]|nr:DNA mismatch repair protein MutS [Phycisphaeraceae bacterium]